MYMKKYLLISLMILLSYSAFPQVTLRENAEYEQYRLKRKEEYNSYREKANKEFAHYLKERWREYDYNAAVPSPVPDVLPEPAVIPTPVIVPKAVPEDDIAFSDYVKRIVNVPIQPAISDDILYVDFYGDQLSFRFRSNQAPYNISVDESGFGILWEEFATCSKELLSVAEDYIEKHHLNGWAIYQLIKIISEQIYQVDYSNERVAMQAYLLSQLKQSAQVAVCGDRYVLLLNFKEQIYEVPYLVIGQEKFYIFSYGYVSDRGYRTYSKNFPYASEALELSIDGSMYIGKVVDKEFLRLSELLGVRMVAPIRMGNIALQYNYPIMDNAVYYRQSLPKDFSNSILNPIRGVLKNMSDVDAVNYLLNLVQNGFDYITDDEAFGRQKQLFVEESFFYGRNNCKDRVGVFSWLVKELIGLDVIAVKFEGNLKSNGIGHIACAVAFDDNVDGDSFLYKNKRYIMCDPTYINAKMGMTMPSYKDEEPVFIDIS